MWILFLLVGNSFSKESFFLDVLMDKLTVELEIKLVDVRNEERMTGWID